MDQIISQIVLSLFACMIGLGLLHNLTRLPTTIKLAISIVPLFALFLPVEWFAVSAEVLGERLHPIQMSENLREHFKPDLSGYEFADDALILGWLSIFAVLMHRSIYRSWQVLSSLELNSAPLGEQELAARGIKISGEVWVHRVANSGAVLASGYFQPRIWIGDALTSDTEIRSAIEHELAHIAGGDQFLLLLIVVLERFNWWNPLAWRLGRLARQYIEYRADERCAQTIGPSIYQKGLAEAILKTDASQFVLFTHFGAKPNIVDRMENLNMTKKFRAAHGVAMLAAAATFCVAASAAQEKSEDLRTLDGCHALLPEGGDYQLKITSTRKNTGGEMSVSFVDLGEDEWETPPAEVLPFLECVRLVVGVGEDEGWPGT